MVREQPGTKKDMQCAATGDPPPLISWLKDGTPVKKDHTHVHATSVVLAIHNIFH